MKKCALVASALLLISPLPAQAQQATSEHQVSANAQKMLAPTLTISVGLGEARENLMAMFLSTDTSSYFQRQQAMRAASAKVDVGLDHANAALIETAAKLKEFGTIWAEFKNSRDTQIVPALMAGNKDAALRIAEGVQAERVKRMRALLESLALNF